MHLNNGGFAYDGFFRYSGVSLYPVFDMRFVFITITPRPPTNRDIHKILVLNDRYFQLKGFEIACKSLCIRRHFESLTRTFRSVKLTW